MTVENATSGLFERRTAVDAGRGYFNTATITKGTVILTVDSPFTSVVYRQFKKEVCANCFTYENGKSFKTKLEHPSTSSKKDRQRAYAGLYFCSENCRAAWSKLEDSDKLLSETLDLIEKAVKFKTQEDEDVPSIDSEIAILAEELWSKALISNGKTIKSVPLESDQYDTARLVAVALVKQYRTLFSEDQMTKAHSNYECQEFDLLQSNESQQLQAFPFLLQAHIEVYHFLRSCLPSHLTKLLTPNFVRDVVGKEAGNAFGIWQLPLFLESECLGSSLFSEASFFNHSCDPNIRKDRIGRAMVFTTTRDIATNEQLCISYGMVNHLSFEERQQQLSKQWYFSCQCSRCSKEQNGIKRINSIDVARL